MVCSIDEARKRLEKTIEIAKLPERLSLMERLAPSLPNSRWYRDYAYGLEDLFEYVVTRTPELLDGGLNVVEIGPGVGCFMVVAKMLGNDVVGEELDLSGSEWLKAYEAIARQWGLGVRYFGFHRYLNGERFPYAPESIDLFHFRGSLDGILVSFKTRGLDVAIERLLALLSTTLRRNGSIYISHNVDDLLVPTVEAIRAKRGNFVLSIDEERVTRLVKP